jgi:hypothetical protein
MAAHPRGLPAFPGTQRIQRTVERHRLPCQVQLVGEVVRLVAGDRAHAAAPS